MWCCCEEKSFTTKAQSEHKETQRREVIELSKINSLPAFFVTLCVDLCAFVVK
jgi:hypothetical protein